MIVFFVDKDSEEGFRVVLMKVFDIWKWYWVFLRVCFMLGIVLGFE